MHIISENVRTVLVKHSLQQEQKNNMKKVTKETRRKMRESALGRKHSFKTREKIKNSLLGKIRTPEQRKHYSKAKRGERSPSAIFSEAEVKIIRRKLRQGVMKADLAREYDTSWSNIHSIGIGKTWKHILTDEDREYIRQEKNHSPKRARLDVEEVAYIKAELARGADVNEIAKAFSVVPQTILNIKLNKTWKDVRELKAWEYQSNARSFSEHHFRET